MSVLILVAKVLAGLVVVSIVLGFRLARVMSKAQRLVELPDDEERV